MGTMSYRHERTGFSINKEKIAMKSLALRNNLITTTNNPIGVLPDRIAYIPDCPFVSIK